MPAPDGVVDSFTPDEPHDSGIRQKVIGSGPESVSTCTGIRSYTPLVAIQIALAGDAAKKLGE